MVAGLEQSCIEIPRFGDWSRHTHIQRTRDYVFAKQSFNDRMSPLETNQPIRKFTDYSNGGNAVVHVAHEAEHIGYVIIFSNNPELRKREEKKYQDFGARIVLRTEDKPEATGFLWEAI